MRWILYEIIPNHHADHYRHVMLDPLRYISPIIDNMQRIKTFPLLDNFVNADSIELVAVACEAA